MNEPLFLTAEEVVVLTGIATGRGGRTREELQCDWLRLNALAHKVNARGAPIVYRSQFLSSPPRVKEEKPQWVPGVLRSGA
ncbi:DUF4224 domain-containing protein [Chitinimonas arctica]|uniref:DUF4224 domain-containing protein n=1 Tax=Chitinimonas arctica TaxID=2594795 RepID=A0A516SJK9_9NEIS|nr:DUF4224 domain-containing protein [Chitinimonas arctica]